MPRELDPTVIDRRNWLRWAALSSATLSGCSRDVPTMEETPADAPLRFPGKVPMRVINDRPPCLETPWEYFEHDLTPNEAFYVRWHLQMIPTRVDTRTWRLRVKGHLDRPREWSLEELKALPQTSVVAVNQCSGNSRGLFRPVVTGAQWQDGAMGNARWTGVSLREILDRSGVRAGAVDVAFQGMDRAGMPGVANFVKSLPLAEARREEIVLAHSMNGEPLPLLNGFPLRLVVPGLYATYWIKALEEITVLPAAFDGYWMAKAYRIPTTPNALEKPGELAKITRPIHRMNVRSFFTFLREKARLPVGQVVEMSGIAFDGGAGIRAVEVSPDGGETWQEARLGDDLGKFSFRRWRWTWKPEQPGTRTVMVRATTMAGETQPTQEGWNRAGYMRNVVEKRTIEIV